MPGRSLLSRASLACRGVRFCRVQGPACRGVRLGRRSLLGGDGVERQRQEIGQRDLLVVPVGSVVDFPNADPWFHNVFSLYRGKRFDLGLYQAGAQRSVRFDRVGPSYLFCNIHPEMTGVVLAVDSSLYAISDKAGRYTINGVAPGKYTLHVWYENAKPESLANLQRTVVLDDMTRALPTISVPVVKQIQKEHKNKYGQDYDPDAMNPDY